MASQVWPVGHQGAHQDRRLVEVALPVEAAWPWTRGLRPGLGMSHRWAWSPPREERGRLTIPQERLDSR